MTPPKQSPLQGEEHIGSPQGEGLGTEGRVDQSACRSVSPSRDERVASPPGYSASPEPQGVSAQRASIPSRGPAALRVLDLFSGLGGFSLGLERTGRFRTVAFCEADPFCRSVLARHWPGVPCYDDVRTLSADRLRADGIGVDVACGGFPCQPFSTASRGRRVAISLWPEFHRVVRALRPAWVVVENVQEEAVTVAALDLDRDGYTTHVRRVGAADAGADHTRDRWWACAHADPQGEFRGAFDAEVARLPAVCRGLWGPENYGRAIRVPDGLSGRLDDAAAIGALGNAVLPQIPEAIGRAILATVRDRSRGETTSPPQPPPSKTPSGFGSRARGGGDSRACQGSETGGGSP